MGTEIADSVILLHSIKKWNSESSFQTLWGSARTSTRLRGKGCSVSRLCTPHHMDDDLPVPPPLPAQSPALVYRAVQFGMPSKISGGTVEPIGFSCSSLVTHSRTARLAEAPNRECLTALRQTWLMAYPETICLQHLVVSADLRLNFISEPLTSALKWLSNAYRNWTALSLPLLMNVGPVG
jgi:hypothetical protein